MTAININALFPVTNNVIQSGFNGVSLSDMVFTTNLIIPFNSTQSTFSFTNLAQVGTMFGSSSQEYLYATNYFKGYDGAISLPNKLNFALYVNSAISPYIRGASSVNNLATLKTITSGSITFVFDTPIILTAIDLSPAISLSGVASIIQTALQVSVPAASCVWDSITQAFTVSNGNISGTGTVTYCVSTPLADAMEITSARGAFLSQGSPLLTFAQNMANTIAINTNFMNATNLFDTTGSSQIPPYSIELQACAWANTTNSNYMYTIWSYETTILTTLNVGIVLALVNGGYGSATASKVTYSATIQCIYGSSLNNAIQTVAFVGGIGNSVNYDNYNSTLSYAGKSQSDLLPSVTTTTEYNMMLANGFNGYCSFKDKNNIYNQFQNGSLGGLYLFRDNIYNNEWLNNTLQDSIATLASRASKLPNNEIGYQMLKAVLDEVMQDAVFNSVAQPGNQFDASQTAIIVAQAGVDITPSLTNAGYYIQIIPVTPAQRASRTPPVTNIWYSNGSSFYGLPMNLTYVF